MTLRDCVQRHGRLPDEIVVDGGKEFQSVWFEVFCKIYAITITRRPPVKPRFGSQIEQLFGHSTPTSFMPCAATPNCARTFDR
jgi:transposase InsO family protein